MLSDAIEIEAAHVMVPDAGDEPPIFAEFRTLLAGIDLSPLGRFAFYDAARAPDLALAVATGERRVYANILLTIGVVRLRRISLTDRNRPSWSSLPDTTRARVVRGIGSHRPSARLDTTEIRRRQGFAFTEAGHVAYHESRSYLTRNRRVRPRQLAYHEPHLYLAKIRLLRRPDTRPGPHATPAVPHRPAEIRSKSGPGSGSKVPPGERRPTAMPPIARTNDAATPGQSHTPTNVCPRWLDSASC